MFVEHSKYHVRDGSHVVSDMLPTGGKQPSGNRKHDALILRGRLKSLLKCARDFGTFPEMLMKTKDMKDCITASRHLRLGDVFKAKRREGIQKEGERVSVPV